MAKNFNILKNKMSFERQERIKKMADKEMQEIVISEIRRFVDMAQNVSQIQFDSSDDLKVSTLAQMIHSLGGNLEVIVHMPTQDIRISKTT